MPPEPATDGTDKDIVLLTGAGGFLGSALWKALTADFKVVGLDRTPEEGEGKTWIRCDFSSPPSIDAAVREVQSRCGGRIASVVHLAGYFDFSGEPNPLYDIVNVDGTRHFLRALRQLEIQQFVYASTMLVHAPTEPGVPINEDSPLGPRWIYPDSKLKTEQVVAQEHGVIPYVLLRIAGVYSQQVQPPTLAHQINWIYERRLESRIFPGNMAHGQSFVHIDDLCDAVMCTVRQRSELPRDLKLLVGEPATLSYEALQNLLGRLIHGEDWSNIAVPKTLAKVGARLKEELEAVVPDSIDRGRKPFVKPFMIELADDHYELDISRAKQLLGWMPRRSLRDELPGIVQALKSDPLGWHKRHRITPPEWLETISEHRRNVHAAVKEYEVSMHRQHNQFLWAHFLNIGLGTWLMASPPILGYSEPALVLSDVVAGALVAMLSALSLSWRLVWARFATATVGVWLLFAPLVFWTASPAAYLNDTLVGAFVIGFSILVRPTPGVGVAARTSGPDIPPGWTYSPSAWTQRILIIALAFIGLYISRYLAAYQLGHSEAAWDPFFGEGTERIITSDVSKAWPVPDAGLGALTYALEILTGMMGGRDRRRTMPWLVILFGLMIVPLGAVSLFFIIIQPIVIGTWCTLCLVAAAAMLIQIPYSLDELVASGQFLVDRHRKGKSAVLAFLRGDTMEEGGTINGDEFERPAGEVFKDVVGGGVTVPWTLVVCIGLGVWLMFTRVTLGTEGAQADSDHLLGALIITVSVSAMAEVGRALRFINVLLAIALIFAPFMFEGASMLADLLGIGIGIVLIILSVPRGKIVNSYGGWSRYVV